MRQTLLFFGPIVTSRRKFWIHANVRSIFHRRRYRRSILPSCVRHLTRLSRWGAIKSVPHLRNRFRNGSLSAALSSTNRPTLFFGQPLPYSWNTNFLINGSINLTSCTDVDPVRTTSGVLWPSPSAIIFVPLPCLVLPTFAPPFLQAKMSRLQKTLPILTVPSHQACREYSAKPPTSATRRKMFGNVFVSCSASQEPKQSFETSPIRSGNLSTFAGTRWRGQEGGEFLPSSVW